MQRNQQGKQSHRRSLAVRVTAPARRFGIGWLEITIFVLAIIGISGAILSIELIADEHQQQSTQSLVDTEMRQAFTLSHLWFEEAYGGDERVDLESDVYANIAYARSLAQALLNGGETPFGELDAMDDSDVRAILSSLSTELAAFRELTEERWAERSGAEPGSVSDQEYDAAFEQILGLMADSRTALEEANAAAESGLRWGDYALVSFLGLLAIGIVVAINRSRARTRAQNARLEQQAGALTQSQARLEEAQQLARLGHFEWHPETGRVWWSDEVYRIYGFVPGSLTPTMDLLRRMIHPDDAENVKGRSRRPQGRKLLAPSPTVSSVRTVRSVRSRAASAAHCGRMMARPAL